MFQASSCCLDRGIDQENEPAGEEDGGAGDETSIEWTWLGRNVDIR